MPTGVYTRTEEAKRRLSEGQKRFLASPQGEAYRMKMSEIMAGRSRAWLVGRRLSEETRRKMSEKRRMRLHPCWTGMVPKGYRVLHYRIRMLYGEPDHCENSTCPGGSKRFQWSSKRHNYNSVARKDWQQLCPRCHKRYDKEHNVKGG